MLLAGLLQSAIVSKRSMAAVPAVILLGVFQVQRSTASSSIPPFSFGKRRRQGPQPCSETQWPL